MSISVNSFCQFICFFMGTCRVEAISGLITKIGKYSTVFKKNSTNYGHQMSALGLYTSLRSAVYMFTYYFIKHESLKG